MAKRTVTEAVNTDKGLTAYSKVWFVGPIIFLAVAAIGLFIVKWNPYFYKAFTAAETHSIGASIITGKNAVAPAFSWNAAIGYATDYFNAVWKAVILGLLLGSLVQVLIPSNWIRRTLGQKGFNSTALAGAASLPGMMCSCCAAPVAVGLRAQQASVGAALAFFLGNPVLNPATIIFMGFVLSWKLALFRVIIGIILVFGIAIMADRMVKNQSIDSSFLNSKVSCGLEQGNLLARWLRALWQLIIDTIPAYLLVVLLLGALRSWLFPVIDPGLSNSILVMIGFAVAGTLFVIPTAAEIPIIQTLMAHGLGIGPSAVLLMTLPAISLPSLLIARRAFPARILVFVTGAVIVVGVISGLLAMVLF